MSGWVDEWLGEWVSRWVDGRVGGWMNCDLQPRHSSEASYPSNAPLGFLPKSMRDICTKLSFLCPQEIPYSVNHQPCVQAQKYASGINIKSSISPDFRYLLNPSPPLPSPAAPVLLARPAAFPRHVGKRRLHLSPASAPSARGSLPLYALARRT